MLPVHSLHVPEKKHVPTNSRQYLKSSLVATALAAIHWSCPHLHFFLISLFTVASMILFFSEITVKIFKIPCTYIAGQIAQRLKPRSNMKGGWTVRITNRSVEVWCVGGSVNKEAIYLKTSCQKWVRYWLHTQWTVCFLYFWGVVSFDVICSDSITSHTQ